MKARVFTSQQRQTMAKVAQQEAEKQIEDATKRAQAIWCLAALNSGLKPSTVIKICKQLPYVLDGFEEYKADGVADYVLFNALKEQGIDIGAPLKTEL